MEYMLSGTPLLTTNLPAMPKEYKKYIYIIENETIEGIRKKIEEILELNSEELLEKGKNAREFVIKNKNNVIQCKKIIKFIK